MRRLTRVSLVLAGSAALVGSMALPSSAATTQDVDVTVTVAGGSLAITAPTATAPEAFAPGSATTIDLAGAEVTDTRAGLAPWTVNAQLSEFATVPAEEEAAVVLLNTPSALYTATVGTPTGNITPVLPEEGVDLSEAKLNAVTVLESGAVSGNNSAPWGAKLVVTLPAQALAGEYTAKLTHSVL